MEIEKYGIRIIFVRVNYRLIKPIIQFSKLIQSQIITKIYPIHMFYAHRFFSTGFRKAIKACG